MCCFLCLKSIKKLYLNFKYYLDFISAASKIEGLPRQSSMHAAGVVLNADALQDVVPVSVDASGRLIEEFEKEGIKIIYFPYTKGISSTKITEALKAVRVENLRDIK